MAPDTYPRLILHAGFSETDALEMEMKGWYPAHAETPDGERYTLTFFEPGRLKQELDYRVQNGEACFVERNLIVVPAVTVAAMEASVRFLWDNELFDDLLPDDQTGDSANPA